MHWNFLKKKGWQFFVNSGEEGHEPHVHAKRGAKEVRVFFDESLEDKKGRSDGNDRREIRKIYDDHQKLCADEWNKHYSNATV